MGDTDVEYSYSAFRRCEFCTTNVNDIGPGVVIHFFKFPNLGTTRREVWVAALLELNPDWITLYSEKETNKRLHLCSMHFLPSDYKHRLGPNFLRAMLEPDAVPSKLGPVVYKDDITQYVRIGPKYSCSCAKYQKSLKEGPKSETKALLTEMELAWHMGIVEEYSEEETSVEEAVSHISTEHESESICDVKETVIPVAVSPQKTAKKRKSAETPKCTPKKKAASIPPAVNAQPKKTQAMLTVDGTLVPAKPAAAVRPNNSAASKITEPETASTSKLATAAPSSKKAKPTFLTKTVTSVRLKRRFTPRRPPTVPKPPLIGKHRESAKSKTKSAEISKPPPEVESQPLEKPKSASFKIFLTEDGKTCYLALESQDVELTSEQLKTAQIIAFQTAQRLGCEVTEPPQLILLKSNDSTAIHKKLIPELENTKVFNVMFKLDDNPAPEQGNQLKIVDLPWNPSDSSGDGNTSQSPNSTTTESEQPSVNESQVLSTSSEDSKSLEDSDSSPSDATVDKDVQLVEVVDKTVPIVISDDSDSEIGNDEQSNPSSKCTSNSTKSRSSTEVTSVSASSDVRKPHAKIATLSTSPPPLQLIIPQQTKTFLPLSSSTPMRPAAPIIRSPMPTIAHPGIAALPKPILQLSTPRSAVSSAITPNCAPTFVTKKNADGKVEAFLVLQPGKNMLETEMGLVQLQNGQGGVISLPASVVQSLALTSAQAGKVLPVLHISNPPAPKTIPLSAPIDSELSDPRVITITPPASSTTASTTISTAGPVAVTITKVKPAKNMEMKTIRAKLTVPAFVKPKDFETNIADFVLEPWMQAMESSDDSQTQCPTAVFAAKAIRETVKLCERLGLDKKNCKLTNLQNKADDISLQSRVLSKELIYYKQLTEKLREDVKIIKKEKDIMKKKIKSEGQKAKRYFLSREELKKQLAQIVDPQELVKQQLEEKMTTVGHHMMLRVFEAMSNPKANNRPYSAEIKEFSLRVHRASRTAYRYIQKVFPDSLATVTTLRSWMRESLDNRDPMLSTLEAVATSTADEEVQDLMNILHCEDLAVEKIEQVEDDETLDQQQAISDEEEEMPIGEEEREAEIEDKPNLVYFFQNSGEVITADPLSLAGIADEHEVLSQSVPEFQAVDQSESANVKVVWAPPQGPANYTLSEDGMSILINVSQDQNYYNNQESN